MFAIANIHSDHLGTRAQDILVQIEFQLSVLPSKPGGFQPRGGGPQPVARECASRQRKIKK